MVLPHPVRPHSQRYKQRPINVMVLILNGLAMLKHMVPVPAWVIRLRLMHCTTPFVRARHANSFVQLAQ